MSSKRELLPAAPVSYDLNDDERLKDLTMPQNRPDTVEVPTFVSSMVDPVQQDAANWKDMSPALIPTIGYTPPRVSPCANTHHVSGGKPANCTNDGKLSCGKCHLVKYCSKDCQVAHWPTHKSDCNSDLMKASWQPAWTRQGRKPTFMGDDGPVLEVFGHLNYLWGNIPAIDVLNVERNEGLQYGEDINLCFAASGDPRNLMCTINGLPTAYKGKCTSILNDKNMTIVARNIIMLLISAQLPPQEAAELIIHLWYSARLNRGMLDALDKYAREPIADIVSKIKEKPNDVIQSKKWTFGTAEITVRLYKPQWTTLLQILDTKHNITKTEQERLKVVLAPSRIDYRDRELCNLPGSSRLCSTRFRTTGVLAPFGSALSHFDCANPLLFNSNDSTWLQKDSASPLEDWSMHSILSASNMQLTAKHDMNGLLYFHIRSVIEGFCHRIQAPNSTLTLLLYCIDAAILPQVLPAEIRTHGFDRIEVSNIADEAYLGLPGTLSTFAPLLKHPSMNPHATLITLFLNAVEIADRVMGNDLNPNILSERTVRVMQYLKLKPWELPMSQQGRESSATMVRVMAAKDLVRDYDRIWEFYVERVGFEGCAERAGVKMRERNTVIEAWPMRLKRKPGEQGADEEFQRLMASSSSGAERYVEWVRKV